MELLLYLAMIPALGITAQWIAWRTRLPGILLLLLFGMALGHFIELYEPNEALTGFYARVKEASINWDGEDAIRTR